MPFAGPESKSKPRRGSGVGRARRSCVAVFVPPLEKVWRSILGRMLRFRGGKVVPPLRWVAPLLVALVKRIESSVPLVRISSSHS